MPSFVFHDGKGFEWASDESGQAIVSFLEEARSAVDPEQQLHAVWSVWRDIIPCMLLNLTPIGFSYPLRQQEALPRMCSKYWKIPSL